LAQEAEDNPDQVALQAAQRYAAGLAFGLAALEVCAGSRFAAALDDGDLVQRRVEFPVAEAVSRWRCC
jgi:hypothetical protein